MNMLLSISFGLWAFWITSIEGFSEAMVAVRDFFSGNWLPLDIISPAFVMLSRAFPFAYTSYIPAQVFLGRMSLRDGFLSLLIEFVWVAILYVLVRLQWRFGIRRYDGIGI